MENVNIIPIPILPLNMVNAHLVIGKGGAILVDTGLPGSENKIDRILVQQNLSWKDIKLIVLTHAHVDHAGAAAGVREICGAPILAHEGDIDFYTGRKHMTFCTTGWVGRVFVKTRFPHTPYTAFHPDILLRNDEVLSLKEYGVEGKVRHTAGHTAGSIVVELSSGDALVGDLIAAGVLIGGVAFNSFPTRPPFEDDPLVVASQLERIIESGGERFYMGHGGPLAKDKVCLHARKLKSRFQG